MVTVCFTNESFVTPSMLHGSLSVPSIVESFEQSSIVDEFLTQPEMVGEVLENC